MYKSLFWNMPPVTKNLLIINILIWALMEFIPPLAAQIDRYAALYYWQSSDFQPWQLVSYLFVHANFGHLFFNMFALLMFGGIIERSLGSQRFLFYYISCGIGAALIQEGVFTLMASHYASLFTPQQLTFLQDNASALVHGESVFGSPEMGMLLNTPEAASYILLLQTPTVGASGAIYGVLLAFGVLYPNLPMYIMFVPMPIKAKWVVIGYGVIELLAGLGNIDSSVAHFAHLGGMIFGLLMLLHWRRKNVITSGIHDDFHDL